MHRDVKRANLLRFLDPGDPRVAGWTVKLGDFGIAVGPHDVTSPAGSPETIAPEQIRGERGELGPWTDLYALGIVAHQLVCGVVPFRRSGRDLLAAHLGDAPVFGPPTMPVPGGLFDWIGALLRKDPTTRYQRAADALADLLALGDEGDTGLADAPAAGPAGELGTFEWDPPTAEGVAVGPGGAPRPRPPTAWPAWRVVREEGRSPHRDAGLSLVPHRRWPVVGQEAVRTALWEGLRSTITAGSARVVELTGPAGSGKSTLLSWLGARADELGLALPFHVRGGPAEALARLAGMPARGGRRGIERWLSRFGPPPDDLVDDVMAAAAAGSVVVEPWFRLAAHVSRHRPVLVLVDEVDESGGGRAIADAAAAARSYADGAWMLVAAGRTAACAVADERLAPEPLADGEATRVLEHVVPLAPGEADRAWREADRDLGRALRSVLAACAAGRALPTADGHVLADPQADEDRTPAAAALAAAGGDVPLDVAPTLLGDAARALADHERAGRLLLPLDTARALWAQAPDPGTNAAATALWRARGDHRRLGLAHAVAGRPHDAAEAWVLECDALLDGEDRPGFFEATGRLTSLLPDLPEPLPSSVVATLASRQRVLGHPDEAVRLARVAIDRAVTPLERWRAWSTLGQTWSRDGRVDDAVEAWEQARVHARATHDPVRWIRNELRAASATPDVARWDRLWAETQATAPSELGLAGYLRAQAFLATDPARALAYLEAAPLSSTRPSYRLAILNAVGLAARRLGDDARAVAAFEECATLARRIGHPQLVVVVTNLAQQHVLGGRDEAAREWTELGLTLALRLTPTPFLADGLRVAQAVLATRAGDAAAAAELLAHVAPRLGPERVDAALLVELLGRLAGDGVAGPVAAALRRRLSGTG